MKKILTTGLGDKTKIQFETIVKLNFPDMVINHSAYSKYFFEEVKKESPAVVVIRVENDENAVARIPGQLKGDRQTENIPVVVLFDESYSVSKPGELFKNSDAVLTLPLKHWETVSLFRLFFKDRQGESPRPVADIPSERHTKIIEDGKWFRSIVEEAPDPIFVQVEMKFAYLNKAACRLFGANSDEELLETPVFERFHPDYHDKIRERIKILNEKEKPVSDLFEQKFVRLDGSEVWVETAGHPIHYNGKNGALVFVRDISARKEAEQKLKESEERWQFALEGTGNGLWDWDLETDKLYFSEQWKLMLGYQPDEVKNSLEEWENKVHPDDLGGAYEAIQKHLNGETSMYQNEQRLRCKDGSYRWILDRGKIISVDKNGKPLRFIGIHVDIHDMKESEKALKESEERFRNTLDSMLEGCQIIGFDWEYKYLNNTAVSQSQLSIDKLLGKMFTEIWPEVAGTELFEKMKYCMDERVAAHMENLFRYPDGNNRWFELSIQPVPEGIFVLSMDITERKKSDEVLKRIKDELELEVAEKTRELKERIVELERFQDATIEREFRIKELSEEVKVLKGEK